MNSERTLRRITAHRYLEAAHQAFHTAVNHAHTDAEEASAAVRAADAAASADGGVATPALTDVAHLRSRSLSPPPRTPALAATAHGHSSSSTAIVAFAPPGGSRPGSPAGGRAGSPAAAAAAARPGTAAATAVDLAAVVLVVSGNHRSIWRLEAHLGRDAVDALAMATPSGFFNAAPV